MTDGKTPAAAICPTTGKRKYSSEREAQASANHRLADPTGPPKLKTYRCLYCNSWHLTSK
jgi:hypothetical protein